MVSTAAICWNGVRRRGRYQVRHMRVESRAGARIRMAVLAVPVAKAAEAETNTS